MPINILLIGQMKMFQILLDRIKQCYKSKRNLVENILTSGS